MNVALYYPFSRCLDDVALKRAVLLYDRLLFVDPVDPMARADLYLREGAAASADPDIAARWMAAANNYSLLDQHGIVGTVDRTVLRDPAAIDALAAAGLHLDLDVNNTSQTLFVGMRRWQMLEARIPPTALDKRFRPRARPPSWNGAPVVELPYAVAASLTLTDALTIAHEFGATPLTDHRRHHQLLGSRLKSASLDATGVPGIYQHANTPYKRRQVELRVAGMLAPSANLKRLSMQDVIDYRQASEPQREELCLLIDRLTHEARHRPWDGALDKDLDRIAEQTREIARNLPGPSSAFSTAIRSLGKPSTKLKLATTTAVTAMVAPNLPLLAGLAAAGVGLGKVGRDVFYDAVDQLRRARTPEENAVAYLLEVGGQ